MVEMAGNFFLIGGVNDNRSVSTEVLWTVHCGLWTVDCGLEAAGGKRIPGASDKECEVREGARGVEG